MERMDSCYHVTLFVSVRNLEIKCFHPLKMFRLSSFCFVSSAHFSSLELPSLLLFFSLQFIFFCAFLSFLNFLSFVFAPSFLLCLTTTVLSFILILYFSLTTFLVFLIFALLSIPALFDFNILLHPILLLFLVYEVLCYYGGKVILLMH